MHTLLSIQVVRHLARTACMRSTAHLLHMDPKCLQAQPRPGWCKLQAYIARQPPGRSGYWISKERA